MFCIPLTLLREITQVPGGRNNDVTLMTSQLGREPVASKVQRDWPSSWPDNDFVYT